MNKILTYTGGQPLYLEHINFMQQNIEDILSHIGKTFANSNNAVILWGAKVVTTPNPSGGANVTCAEGAIYLMGNIYKVEASSITVANIQDNVYYQVYTTTSEETVFQDGTSHNVYQISVVKLGVGGSGAININVKNALSLRDAYISVTNIDYPVSVDNIVSNTSAGISYSSIDSNTDKINVKIVTSGVSLSNGKICDYTVQNKMISAIISAGMMFQNGNVKQVMIRLEYGSMYLYESNGSAMTSLPACVINHTQLLM